jgi:hypothetical protein
MRTSHLLLAAALVCPATAADDTTRDPWLWPFAGDSIWNTPIGDGAVYHGEGHFQAEGTIGADVEFLYRLGPNPPKRKLYEPAGWPVIDGKRGRFFRDFPIDDDILVRTHISNNVAAFLLPDGTVEQLGPFMRMHRGGELVGIPHPFGHGIPLTGPGIIGGHWGSGMSSLGGSLRHGELTGDAPIRHALKIDVQGRKYLRHDRNDPTPGFRWPAIMCDNYAGKDPNDGGYNGKDPRFEMGALLAIHPRHTAASLGLTTKPAKKILQALQDYGAYIVDDAGSDSYWFCPSYEATGEFREVFGYDLDANPGTRGPGKDWYDDVMKLVRVLAVIDNNRADNVAGGGKRRRPPAPPIGAIGTRPPTAPGTPTIVATGATSVTLSWGASRDDVRVMTYRVFNAGNPEPVAETFGRTRVEVTGLRPATAYEFTVQALDTGWNRSPVSGAVKATTQAVAPGTILEDFDDGVADGWTLSGGAAVRTQRLEMGNWGGDTRAVCDGSELPSGYTLSVHLFAQGGASANVGRVLLRERDERNRVVLEFGGGADGPITLFQVVDGRHRVLASARGWTGQVLKATYTSDGAITLVLKHQDGERTLVEGVKSDLVSGGHLGFETRHNNLTVDDVRLVPLK